MQSLWKLGENIVQTIGAVNENPDWFLRQAPSNINSRNVIVVVAFKISKKKKACTKFWEKVKELKCSVITAELKLGMEKLDDKKFRDNVRFPEFIW